jgi:hypothetical protein
MSRVIALKPAGGWKVISPPPRFSAHLPIGHSNVFRPVAVPSSRSPCVSRKSVSRGRLTFSYCTSQEARAGVPRRFSGIIR